MTTREFDALLLVDFDGHPVEDPEEVIGLALDGDTRYLERVPHLVEMLRNEDVHPYERFVACLALISWAEPAGYRSVIEAAKSPEAAPWYGHSLDRRFSVDDTFAQMADAIETSTFLSASKGVDALRIDALRSLVAIADQQYFEWKLAAALDEQTVILMKKIVSEVVERGVRIILEGRIPPFDLATQLADLAAALAPADEPEAVRLGYLISGAPHSVRTLIHLCAIPARGQLQLSMEFADYLRTLGGQDVSEALGEALAHRLAIPRS